MTQYCIEISSEAIILMCFILISVFIVGILIISIAELISWLIDKIWKKEKEANEE